MNRVFKFETAVKTGLMVTLAVAVVFAGGCTRKPGKSSSPASSEKNSSERKMRIRPAAEVNQNEAVAHAEKVVQPAAEVNQKTVTTPVKPAAENNTVAAAEKSVKEVKLPEPPDFEAYKSLSRTNEKVAFITEYAYEHPGAKAFMVYKVLDDNDADVRRAAMEMLAMEGLDDPNVVYVVAKAFKDSEAEIHKSAIEACVAITAPAVEGVLLEAINDSSEEVRTLRNSDSNPERPCYLLSHPQGGHHELLRGR